MSVKAGKMNFITNLPKTELPFAPDTQSIAENALENLDLPTTRVEAWKYTRVAKIGKIDFRNTKGNVSSIEDYTIIPGAPALVFVNGHFSEEFSTQELPEGIQVELLSKATEVANTLPVEGEIFNALNTAHLIDGVTLSIAKNSNVETPVQILHILDGDAEISNFRTQIHAETFSKAGIVLGFFSTSGSNQCFANVAAEIQVDSNAHLTVNKVQFENEASYHINTEQVKQEKDSTFTINTITLNGGLVRNNLNIDVEGENCTTNLNGAYLLKGKQHVDNHTVVDHKVPNCQSNELYKGVMDEKSTAVFNGKVFVRQDAQKINAFQSNRNVLLSDDASINSKPELEIYADDVKCSHGSTTGQLDEDAVFYLRARGLSEKSAMQLLVSAFITEVIEHIENESVRVFVFKLLRQRFGWDISPEDLD